MDPEEYRKKIEVDILKIIEEKLTNGQMDVGRAKAISRMVLEKLHPPLPLEQIYQVVPTLDDEFAELSKVVMSVNYDHEKRTSEAVSKHAEGLIKSGKFDEAHQVLKQATESKQA